jgi:hypothetical protein
MLKANATSKGSGDEEDMEQDIVGDASTNKLMAMREGDDTDKKGLAQSSERSDEAGKVLADTYRKEC